MDYISAAQTAEKWGVSLRQVQRLLADGRVPGVQKIGRAWLIPRGEEKPVDPRRERIGRGPSDILLFDLTGVIESTVRPLTRHDPDAILSTVEEERLRLQYEGELAYLRGDFAQTMRCYRQTQGDDAARLRACPVAVAAAISLGDYRAYEEIETYLKGIVKANRDTGVAAFAELALATAAVSAYAPGMVPDWLRDGDLDRLPPQARPDALYLRAKYFNSVHRIDAMLATAQTALSLRPAERSFTMPELYLRIMCAVACHTQGHAEEAGRWLLEAMRIALPNGFVTPFAEVVSALGGLVEQCLGREFPTHRDAVLAQWKRTWKNWIAFHNQFTRDNITLMLSLREYHIAVQVSQRVPYAKIAAEQCISVGRLKNIILDIYGKLLISNRDELKKYVF